MTRILLVEDDDALAESLQEYLRAEGFELLLASSAAAARACGPGNADLVLLDWMLPDGPGIDLLREWREQRLTVPVLLLTARTELVDRVVGLELGANDYITKPFEPRELLARIRVQLRQLRPQAPEETVIAFAGIELSPTTRVVSYRGRPVDLTRQEFGLLKLFLENPNRVFSREEILNQAWGYEHFPSTRTVDTHVLQLRQKIDSVLFETIRGIGYRLRKPQDLAED